MKKIGIFLMCLVGWTTQVVAADLYQVDNIPIVAEVNNAKEARAVAIANGQVDAFWQLVRKMVQNDDLIRIPLLGQNEVVDFVQNVSLMDEKTTATKYMAVMTVTFKPRAIQDFLTENQVPFLVQAPPAALIVPVYRHGDAVWLVEADSPVYNALKSVVSKNGLFEWVLPESDENTASIIREAWTNPDVNVWGEVLSGIGVGRVVLWEVTQVGPTVSVTTKAFPVDREEWDQVSFQTIVPSGNIRTAVPILFERTEALLEKNWRSVKTNNLETPNSFWITVPIKSVTEWVAIRQKLRTSGFLDGLDVRGFRPRQVLVALQFKGTGEQLDEQLKSIGLQVKPMPNSSAWELTELVIEPTLTEGE